VTSHLRQLVDDAVRTELGPLGEAIEQAVGELDDEQRHVVAVGLQTALMVGLRVAFVEAAAQVDEQLKEQDVRCDACGQPTALHFDVDLKLAIEPDPPPQ
jgi:hypothetical protein